MGTLWNSEGTFISNYYFYALEAYCYNLASQFKISHS